MLEKFLSSGNATDYFEPELEIQENAGSGDDIHAKVANYMKCGNRARLILPFLLFHPSYRLLPPTGDQKKWRSLLKSGRQIYTITTQETLAQRNNLAHGALGCNGILAWWKQVDPAWLQAMPVLPTQ